MMQTATADAKKAPARGNSKPSAAPDGLHTFALPKLGNQASLRLQRKCDCGGAPDCNCDMANDRKKEKDSPKTALHRKHSENAASPVAGLLDAESESFFRARLQRKESGPASASGASRLQIGAVDDPLEHEADAVADRVMRMPDPVLSFSSANPQISRKCASCEEEEKLQKKADTHAPVGREAPPIVHEVLRSPGQPLDRSTRAFMEARLGHDFGAVKVHTGSTAAASAKSVNALAYTVGSDLVFGSGTYAPDTEPGRRLLAHELVHTIQQNTGGVKARRTPQHARGDHPPPEVGSLECSETYSGPLSAALPSGVRDRMEGRLGIDTSGVRVNADAPAGREAASIGARAFTKGRELYFARGQYDPRSSDGQALIAHELAHVAQQRQGRANLKGSMGDLGRIAAANSGLEREATAVEKSFIDGEGAITVSRKGVPGFVQRSPDENAQAPEVPGGQNPSALSTMGDVWDAVQAAAKGGLQAVADFVAEKAAATDALIGDLNDLRKSVMASAASVILSQETVALAASIFSAFASYIPPWLPVPELKFGPVQPVVIVIVAGVALGAAELALILAMFLCLMWILMRANPGVRKAQDKAIEDLINKIKEDLKPKKEADPKKKPDPEPDDPPPPIPDPSLPRDACFENLGLVPDASRVRWSKPRSPITKDGVSHITVSDAAFRLDKGVPPPAGEDASKAASQWARSIGMPEDDAGHVIGNRFGGTTKFNAPDGNIFPQDLSQNRGGMRDFDALMAGKHAAGCDVCVHVGLLYASDTALRPEWAIYTYQQRCGNGFDPPVTTRIPNSTAKRPAP